MKTAGRAPVDLDVILPAVEEEADGVRVAIGIFLANLAGAVGGLVLADQDLDGEVRLLHQDTVQAVADEVGVLVGVDLDRYHGLRNGLKHTVAVFFNRRFLVSGFEFFEGHMLKQGCI